MTVYLKILARFFKAWFMPQPAHDQFDSPESETPPVENELPPPANNDLAPPHNSQITSPGNPEPDPGEIPPDPVNRNIANIDISHLINPPEGSEGRASRGTEIDDPSITE